jgi:hypothetical protein
VNCDADTCGFILKYDDGGSFQSYRNLNAKGYASLTSLRISDENTRWMAGYLKGQVNYTGQNTTTKDYGAGFFLSKDCETMATGLERTDQGKTVNTYPNPASSQLIIEKPPETAKWSFELANQQGQAVQSGSFTSGTYAISTGQLPSGLYFLALQRADRKHPLVQKVIIR